MDLSKFRLRVNAIVMWHYLEEQSSHGITDHIINYADIDRKHGISKHRQVQGLNELERCNLIIQKKAEGNQKHKVYSINESML